ncbi:hypothetical protein EYF80_038085 [Liparis tanakae]|uniref:Uncharacterized protein n=1 Tax=Liparis tanakae TaxID=230148 RepID=A0A4Z2GFK5_9TELE|nr:hypothetical protein EYF80_038085 [Liparis tanakae]
MLAGRVAMDQVTKWSNQDLHEALQGPDPSPNISQDHEITVNHGAVIHSVPQCTGASTGKMMSVPQCTGLQYVRHYYQTYCRLTVLVGRVLRPVGPVPLVGDVGVRGGARRGRHAGFDQAAAALMVRPGVHQEVKWYTEVGCSRLTCGLHSGPVDLHPAGVHRRLHQQAGGGLGHGQPPVADGDGVHAVGRGGVADGVGPAPLVPDPDRGLGSGVRGHVHGELGLSGLGAVHREDAVLAQPRPPQARPAGRHLAGVQGRPHRRPEGRAGDVALGEQDVDGVGAGLGGQRTSTRYWPSSGGMYCTACSSLAEPDSSLKGIGRREGAEIWTSRAP